MDDLSSLNNERIAAGSKVNFSKLSEKEKNARFKNMAKMIKTLKSKIRTLRRKYDTIKHEMKTKGIHKPKEDSFKFIIKKEK